MPSDRSPSTRAGCATASRRLGARARGVAELAAALGAAALLGACAGPRREPGTVVYASGADLESANPLVTIHPLARQVQRHALFVTLARYDESLAARPYFAREWTWSADRRVLRFHLEPALRWHDGRATTAADVAFTLDAARDPATGFPRASELDVVQSVRAVDDTTIELRFRQPPAAFPGILAELPIVPRHLLDSVPRRDLRRAAFSTSPVGNGPFRFVSRVAGQQWRFARDTAFPASMGGPPRVERLVVAVVDEATTKLAGLVSGDLDVAGVSPTMASLVERDPALRLERYPVLFANALVLNAARPPFDDVRVRRAIDRSVDRERLVAAALAGFGVASGSPVAPDNPLAAGIATGRDTVLADSLLDAAGWRRGADGWRARDGVPLGIEMLTVGSGDNAVEQLLQADLRARGIHAGIRQRELGAFLAEARASPRRFDALVSGIPGDLSLGYLAAMFDSRQAGGALDYAGFHTPRLDARFEAVRGATEAGALAAAWAEVQRELAREVPVVWLYHARGVQGVSRRLGGVRMDLRGELATVARWTTDRDAPPLARASRAPSSPR
ncbi:MAG TPA: peptide ABC transporter substrate-binding protein [Gemmatimonadaceae bacterium]